MPCPHSRSTDDEDHGIERREFMKTALAIGGTSAMFAAKARGEPVLQGSTEGLPERQYAWNDFMPKNGLTGLAKTPAHHLQLLLDYTGDGTPTEDDREQVEAALRTLEDAYEWDNEGLMFTIGYSLSYFDRFDEDLPEGTGMRPPEDIIDETDIASSGQITADHADAHLHLASKHAHVLLEAEEALFGAVDEVNGVDVETDLSGVFEKTDRRTGFIGNPKERWDEDLQGKNPIEEGASVFFGFKSLFTDSQPSEDDVAIQEGPFADGTTEQVSLLLDNNVKQWYNKHDIEERIERMYSPSHTLDETGRFGRELAPTSAPSDEKSMGEAATETAEDAEEKGVVGHAQKLARARVDDPDWEDGRPLLLRRDFPSTDGGRAHTQFISNQRSIDDFISVRKAMAFVDWNADDPDPAESEVQLKDHGIQGHFKVQSRGTYLVPPRDLRALPPANP
ncbi:Tat pathway signal protein [Haloarchaeobius sp. HME9146]|uniref:DUF7405 family protein n=1 Tax=Haloarchaeobius sp. HME9146 TaxID=2978732 RepID=UPI0021C0A1F1|nr:Tat pathway signal protein [Haloarchaeobius sp. HME9146]MCT9095172.1 Tat pathway signal protein [Haloarchaeobius sp. HME9146]